MMIKNKFFEISEEPFVYYEEKDENKDVTFQKSKRTLFDHLKAITQKEYDPNYFKNYDDVKTFDVYMINRFLSMNPDWVFLINILQQYTHDMPTEMVYKVYSNIIPKSKIFLKYVKNQKRKIYKKELIELFSKHYECSNKDASDLITILFAYGESGIRRIIEICKLYALKDEEIKKMVVLDE